MQFPAMNAQIPSAQPSHQMGQSEKKPSYVEAMPVPQGSQTIGYGKYMCITPHFESIICFWF